MRNLIEPCRLFLGFFIPLICTSVLLTTFAFIWSLFAGVAINIITAHPGFIVLFAIMFILQTIWTMMWLFEIKG